MTASSTTLRANLPTVYRTWLLPRSPDLTAAVCTAHHPYPHFTGVHVESQTNKVNDPKQFSGYGPIPLDNRTSIKIPVIISSSIILEHLSCARHVTRCFTSISSFVLQKDPRSK